MKFTDQYLTLIEELFSKVVEKNRPTLESLGEVIGKSIAAGGVLHTFGSGHSGIIAQELVHRAGGFVPVSAIVDPTGGWPETLPGYSTRLVQRYHYQHELREGETILVISNSGVNPSPIEVALGAKELGLNVVAVTSLEVSKQYPSNHESGKRLFDLADYVIDNCGLMGDAAIEVPGEPSKVGPTSTMTSALLLNLLSMEIVQYLTDNGHPLPVLRSTKLPGAHEFNAEVSARYKHRLSRPI